MKEREELITQAKLQADVSAAEVAQLFADGSIAFRLLGRLFREEELSRMNFMNADLVSEEGRLRAIGEQGVAKGRAMILEKILDLMLEGSEENDGTEHTEL